MASVNPPIDGGYQYYAKSVDDLEEDFKADRKRARENQEEREARLEKNYLEGLRKQEEDSRDTVETTKKTANETLEQQQLKNKEDINQLKKQTYDRFGKFQAQQMEDMKRQFDNAQEEFTTQSERTKKNAAATEERLQKRNTEIEERANGASEAAIKKAKDSSLEATQRAHKNSIATNEENLRQLKSKYDTAIESTLEQGNVSRTQAIKSVDEAKKTFDRQLQSNKEVEEGRFEKLSQGYAEKETRNAALSERSRELEIGKLSNQLTDLIEAEKNYGKEKGQGRQEALKEFENSARMNEQNIISSYEADLNATKKRSDDAERAFADMHNRTLREKDLQNAKLTQGIEKEHHVRERDNQTNYGRNVKQLKDINEKERALSLSSLEKQAQNAQENAENALHEQSLAYQKTLQDNQSSAKARETALSNDVQNRRTSSDISLISPGAEEELRRSIDKGYAKNFEAEKIRNRDQTDSIHRNLQGKIFDTKDKYESEMTRMQQTNELARHLERSEFLQHIQETELGKGEALRNQDRNQVRSSEYMNKVYAQSLEKQRKQYEDMIANIKTDASLKQQTIRQESDYRNKMAQRTFANQQNELIRNYEKRMADQKLMNEDTMSEIKAQADKAVADKEKQMKQSVDEVARNYEQRIAQLEVQHKERERYAAQNFEDQLEKVKRSNALLTQKKS